MTTTHYRHGSSKGVEINITDIPPDIMGSESPDVILDEYPNIPTLICPNCGEFVTHKLQFGRDFLTGKIIRICPFCFHEI